ncbi:MAG: hypothetical protein HC897_01470 [Thermoanaerobaculia bacterium]|nr:hypothetical protein [Thermoanaerobaculia bacterium]
MLLLLALLLAGVALYFDQEVPVALLSADTCYKMDLRPQPTWFTRAQWNQDESAFLLLEPTLANILQYSTARFGTKLIASSRATSERIVKFQVIPSGLILETSEDEIVWLDSSWNELRRQTLTGTENHALGIYRSSLDWYYYEGIFFSFGFIETPDGSWRSGLAAVRKQNKSFDILDEVPWESPARLFYQFGFNYLTATSTAVYFLNLSAGPKITEIALSGADDFVVRKLDAFPGGYETLPVLPTEMNRAAARAVYSTIENSKMIIGLFASESMLFLLERERSSDGATEWRLITINPTTDRIEAVQRLPTKAPHLVVVPGSRYWVLFEKGHVEDFGKQSTDNAILVPSAWIYSSTLEAHSGACG